MKFRLIVWGVGGVSRPIVLYAQKTLPPNEAKDCDHDDGPYDRSSDHHFEKKYKKPGSSKGAGLLDVMKL
jgi:hypothetical protein